ncbi:LysR family transcriptional regulator [Candidatus Tokpelaia sp.]|uniref:LysR family transcriptional regulator n=1 Tax=Candidatus Tokpelaia sp. TaxID=2233777 RepID=UPI00123B53C1|nr:LysR family transcriptional regulator [Candidatus Tokpelaia sp.]KAA6405778.1 LysR family transcriptional regulator [Candidatus Tokpelaia sp.]
MAKAWKQLDNEALSLLRAGIEKLGSIKAVADKIGYSRGAVSTALAGKYVGGTGKMRAAIMERLNAIMLCPHLGKELTAIECRLFRERRCPTSNRAEVKHWQACRICKFNPEAVRMMGEGNETGYDEE